MFLQIILDNLLKNAFKYSDQKIRVALSKDVKQFVISIEDDGQGIPKALREEMLLPFARADKSRNQSTGGYGLGLAIVDTLVAKLEATISLEDSSLGGLKCEIIFPF